MLTYPDIGEVALSLGPLQVRWYGLMYLVGFAAAWWLGRHRAARSGLGPGPRWTAQQVDDLITYCVVGLILGARVGYTLFYNFSGFADDPLEILRLWHGGMSFHGGALGVALALWLFSRRSGHGLAEVADFLVPLAPPGLLAGRLGNFINGELWGRPTDLPWAMVFPDPAAGNLPRHPSQLYEALLEGLVLFVILWVYSRKKRPPLAVAGMFLFLYGLFRFVVEFAREPDAQLGFIAFNWMSMGQLLCLPMLAVGGVILLRAGVKGRHSV